eukprot:6234839-Pyramimonas_sp.AAC.1
MPSLWVTLEDELSERFRIKGCSGVVQVGLVDRNSFMPSLWVTLEDEASLFMPCLIRGSRTGFDEASFITPGDGFTGAGGGFTSTIPPRTLRSSSNSSPLVSSARRIASCTISFIVSGKLLSRSAKSSRSSAKRSHCVTARTVQMRGRSYTIATWPRLGFVEFQGY